MHEDMFSPTSGAGEARQLIPSGTLHFALFHTREIRTSAKTGGRYADIELTLLDGPFERRKIWTLISDPMDPKNVRPELRNEGKMDGAQLAVVSLTRILETAGVFNPANPSTYKQFIGKTFEDMLQSVELAKVAIKIKIKKGSEGYEDKNDVGEWLSSNPGSGGHDDFKRLIGGSGSLASARQAAFSPPTAGPVIPPRAAAPQVGNAPGWLTKPASHNPPF